MTDQPEGQRWTIYVCEACGDYGWVFGSEHSIPLTCPEPGEDHPNGRHRGPYRKVEVIPASSVAELQRLVHEATAGVENLPGYERSAKYLLDDWLPRARSALHPELTEENDA